MSLTNPIMKQVDSFTVTGFRVKTQNSDEFNKETAKIPNLWQQFYASNLAPNSTIFSVYSDYETDANGQYTVTLGLSNASHGAPLPATKVNSGSYLIFQGKGSMPETVIATWQRVWDYFSKENGYQRCFMTDFEAYTNKDEVSIYIGVE